MNPITNAKNQQKLTERELALGLTNKKSWHDKYKDSAWIFIGGLPYDLTEGDVICVFSQYGEIVNINLVRDKKTGKSKGFCFICYEDQKSTVLTVDNLNGIKLLGRILRVDHVEEYRAPKEHGDEDEITLKMRREGCAPQVPVDPEPPATASDDEEEDPLTIMQREKKQKKLKKEKKKKKKKKKVKQSSSESESSSEDDQPQTSSRARHDQGDIRVKKEKHDPGYDRALYGSASRATGGGGSKQSHSPEDRDSYHQKYSKTGRNGSNRDRDDFNRDRGRNFYDQPRDKDRNDRDRTDYRHNDRYTDNHKPRDSYHRDDRGARNDRSMENDNRDANRYKQNDRDARDVYSYRQNDRDKRDARNDRQNYRDNRDGRDERRGDYRDRSRERNDRDMDRRKDRIDGGSDRRRMDRDYDRERYRDSRR